jgi:hypothetical protein
MFFHHLGNEEIPPLLTRLNALAKRGLIINDLLRTWAAYLGIKTVCSFIQNRPFRYDAPLSVRRGFRENEINNFVKSCGFGHLQFYYHFACRFALAGEKHMFDRGSK